MSFISFERTVSTYGMHYPGIVNLLEVQCPSIDCPLLKKNYSIRIISLVFGRGVLDHSNFNAPVESRI